MVNDTIAAVATGITNSGISIIRISGPDSFSVIERLFKKGKTGGLGFIDVASVSSHTVHYGCIAEPDSGRIIDEVMVLIFKEPLSYTRENVVEIDCHGGAIVTKEVFEAVLKAGARAAEPGEFTKRAFLNGRIDLSQAEAVINLINAKNKMAADNSLKQLSGIEYKKVSSIRDRLLHDTAYIEAALDDPEHIDITGFASKLLENISTVSAELEAMIKSADNGRLISEGINTVIVGKPNAGKSTLLNAILGEERAIVTEIAGTTRDTLEETVSFGGVSLNLTDTAGIRKTENVIEKIGVERAINAAASSDLILYVMDCTEKPDEEDRQIIEKIKDRRVIALINKSDLDGKTDLADGFLKENGLEAINISAKNGYGIDRLAEKIKEMFFNGDVIPNDEVYITSARHKECLVQAKKSLECVADSIENGMSEDFFTIDLMNAYTALGQIIGEDTDEDLTDRIFRDFCMGK